MPNNKEKKDKPAFQPSIFDWQKQAENKERKIFKFPEGTPIWRGAKGWVYAEKEFFAERVEGKVSGYGAFKLLAKTLVYRQRGWEPKSYFDLQVDDIVGMAVSKTEYRPKKFKQTL